MPFALDSKDWFYDYKTGHVQRRGASLFNLTSNHLFQRELKKYIRFWNTEFVSLASIGYKVGICLIGISFRYNLTIVQNGVNGYTMSAFDWLRENEYPLLLLLFVEGMVPYGYGDVMQVPAVCTLISQYIY
jgi:hypothetical protein